MNAIINAISNQKKIIFADLKLHDIPNTCVSATKAIRDLKVNYLTIHISSGLEALKAVKKISGKTKSPIKAFHLSKVPKCREQPQSKTPNAFSFLPQFPFPSLQFWP